MKIFSLFAATLTAGLLLCGGCASIEIKPPGDADRVLTGTVNYPAEEALPPAAVLSVRLLNPADGTVLGEQTITNPGPSPVAFHIEYRADDVLLQHGLSLEARISAAGRLRFYNVSSYAVTFTNAFYPQTVWVNPAGK